MRKLLVTVFGFATGVALIAGGVIALERLTRDQIAGQPQYQLAFADVECAPPPGMDRTDFLAEVQYLADLPDTLPLLRGNTLELLAVAFGRHPWVEKVESVELASPNRVRVRLRFRVPILAVLYRGNPTGPPQVRVVAAGGVQLPASTSAHDLPLLLADVAAPHEAPGKVWNDPVVRSAALVADRLRQVNEIRADELRFKDDILIVRTTSELLIYWGGLPSDHSTEMDVKIQRLRRVLAGPKKEGLAGPYLIDLR